MSGREYKAWLVDLDGTLYHARPLKLAMACELLVSGWFAIGVLRTFRREHEQLRSDLTRDPDAGGHDLDGDPYQRQIERTAAKSGRSSDEVRQVVERWMQRRPGKWLALFRRSGLLGEIREFRQQGGQVALVSDYPARVKLAAMGVAELFDVVVASGEEGGPRRLKPAADGYLLAAERLGVSPQDCLVIGDRHDADGLAAEQAGMGFRRIL